MGLLAHKRALYLHQINLLPEEQPTAQKNRGPQPT